jgi:hypothetical protein
MLALACALAVTASSVPAKAATALAPAPLELAATLAPAELFIGARTSIAGRLVDAGQGVAATSLALQSDPFPYRGFVTIARAVTQPDGSYSFTGIAADRDTRLRVVDEGQPTTTSAELLLTVDPGVMMKARSLGAGETRLSLRVRHTSFGSSPPVSVYWFAQARGSRVYRLAAVTQSRELSAGLLYATATIDPPSRRFTYRVCLNPAWEDAMGPGGSHGRCPRGDFVLRAGHGR